METSKKRKMEKFIGMRVIKTVLAVYICFLVSFFRSSLPFYSAIAAILCMQADRGNSFAIGINRIKGTLIGGAYGFLTIVVTSYIGVEIFSHLYYLLLSLILIPIIYTNVHLDSKSSTYISCVVFLSITVAHGGDSSPIYFTLNRVVDTLIGIGVSFGVNIII